jgi:2-(1,2-epoxy-1,2-dihydrophenyl)acetyl-CoA isomerase
MQEQTVLLEVSEGVAMLTLNEPETLNAITPEMVARLIEVVGQVDESEDVRAVILTGAGRGFCSGLNLTRSAGDVFSRGSVGIRQAMQAINGLLTRIAEMEKPWLAAVNGPAVGGGFSLALTCDLVMAAESAYFSAGYVKVGLMMDMGLTYLLPHLAGLRRANELAFFGERLPAAEAASIGLINRLLPDDDLMEAAREWALRLAQGPTLAIAANKLAMRRALHSTYRQALDWESLALPLIAQSEDLLEGLSAFVQKRDAQFKGR